MILNLSFPIILIFGFLIFYCIFTIALLLIWLRQPVAKLTENFKSNTTFSIIIPIRNEAENISKLLQDIDNQTYPKHLYEVIIADDASTDNSVSIIEDFKKEAKCKITVLKLSDIDQNTSPKKRAITQAIELANGELITTTDGDCRVAANWLRSLAQFYAQKQSVLISGGVSFFDKIEENDSFLVSIWNKIQIIEFASLVGSAASSMFVQQPNMCSGANLTYKKSVFYEVNGFAGNENLASGDDEFLMHKIAKKYPSGAHFIKNAAAIVETQAHISLKSFYFQRKRWASKWKHYTAWQPTLLAIFIFMSNLSFLLLPIFFFLQILDSELFIIGFCLKTIAEFILLSVFCEFLNKKKVIPLIPLVQLIYPFYVVFFGLVVQGKTEYFWKERKLK